MVDRKAGRGAGGRRRRRRRKRDSWDEFEFDSEWEEAGQEELEQQDPDWDPSVQLDPEVYCDLVASFPQACMQPSLLELWTGGDQEEVEEEGCTKLRLDTLTQEHSPSDYFFLVSRLTRINQLINKLINYS